jgi:GxxExxY protein
MRQNVVLSNDGQSASSLLEKELTDKIIHAAIEVHKALGPGLLESAYQTCMVHESKLLRLNFEQQIPVMVTYKGIQLDGGYRLDLVYEKRVIVEIKAVEQILPVHEAQLLTYLKLTGIRVGLLLNFNVPMLKNGIYRRVF